MITCFGVDDEMSKNMTVKSILLMLTYQLRKNCQTNLCNDKQHHIIREINTIQINIEPETGEERNNEAVHNTHQYNLLPRPTKRNPKYV